MAVAGDGCTEGVSHVCMTCDRSCISCRPQCILGVCTLLCTGVLVCVTIAALHVLVDVCVRCCWVLIASTLCALLQNPPRWIVYHELVLTSKEYARTVTEIRPDWLLEIAPHMYSSKDIAADLNKKMPKTQGRAAMDA